MSLVSALLMASAIAQAPVPEAAAPPRIRAVAVAGASVIVLRAERAGAVEDDPQAARRQVRRSAGGVLVEFE